MPRYATGNVKGNRRRLVCDIAPDVFDDIAAADLPGCTSMSAKIRLLLEWGLMVHEDDAAEDA